MKSLRSPLLSQIKGVRHGFGTRAEPVPLLGPEFESAWERRPKWKQVHACAVSVAVTTEEELGECDALLTQAPALPIGVVTADCVPILLARKDGEAVAAVHAGWRGTQARIVESLIRRVDQELGFSPGDWVAAIGPSARPCCYEVSPELAGTFQKEFGEPAVQRERYLDLQEVNRRELTRLGLVHVDVLPVCTICTKSTDGSPAFESHRRDHARGRQYSVIQIREASAG